jgi:hypothetical protein
MATSEDTKQHYVWSFAAVLIVAMVAASASACDARLVRRQTEIDRAAIAAGQCAVRDGSGSWPYYRYELCRK